ncbi:hypothetical protein N7488_006323 [Penicillium malachiteum]|nr:hypothetical protein N7488_006323 [Penicillium malachiteum]
MNLTLRSRVDDKTLKFTEDGSFRISVFNDLHFAENATRDSMTQDVMSYILSKERSDLVVLNGDLISGEATNGNDSGTYLHQIFSPLVDAGKVWASTYGNHDSEINLDPMKHIFHEETQYPNSLTQSMISPTKAGISNYYLPGGHLPKSQSTESDSLLRGDLVDESVVEWFVTIDRDL